MKVSGGLVGITLNDAARSRWFLTTPELTRLSQEIRTLAGVETAARKHHHELSPTVVEREEANVSKLKKIMKSSTNPFVYEGDELVNVISMAVMPDDVKNDLCNQTSIGQKHYEQFVQDRIVTGSVNIWSPMKKVNLKSWKAASKRKKPVTQVTNLKDERALFARLIVSARARTNIDVKQALGEYEFSSYPRALFSSTAQLLPCTDKSKLMPVLEALGNEASTANAVETSHEKRAICLDGMAIVQEIGKPTWIKTCADFGRYFCSIVAQKVRRYDEVHLIFDRYDLPLSLKEATRNRRQGSTTDLGLVYQVTDTTHIANVSHQKFLARSSTKDQLTVYLAQKVIEAFRDTATAVVVAFRDCVTSNNTTSVPVDHLRSSHEEADTKLILHAHDAVRRGATEVDIESPDTDVFLLALRRIPQLCPKVNFITGTGACRRAIQLRPIYDALGAKRSAALMGFHAFTGSDTTGRFAGKGKVTWFKAFLKSDDEVLEAFTQLGKVDELHSDVPGDLERFVCKVYAPETDLNDIALLRWHLFSKTQAEGEKLPPTRAALLQKVHRSQYQALIWENDLVPLPNLPPPTTYGWIQEGHSYSPVPSLQPSAPKSIVELVKCGCVKSQCTSRCSCKQNDMFCTEMCQCGADAGDCQNIVDYSEVAIGDSSDDDDD